MMRKNLLGTTALLAFSAAALPAGAAEWNVRVGGFMEQYVGYVDVDAPRGPNGNGDFNGIDSKQDAEVWFLPSITLDNGIKIGANIQLEAATGSDQIDESFMQIDGSFGQILLGSENSAGYKMHYAAPDVTFINVNSGSFSFFVPFSGTVNGVNVADDLFRGTLQTTYLENVRNNDAQRFTYFTPRFQGFQLGVSYARDALQDTNLQVDRDNPPAGNVGGGNQVTDIFDIGANYVQSFGDVSVALSGRWGTASGHNNAGSDDPTIWSVGGNLGYAGFTIGGSYAEQNNAGLVNGQAYDAGISYETGPWGFSFTYFHGENIDNENPGTDEENDQYLLGAAYKVAKGVALNAYGGYMEFDEDRSDGGLGNGDDLDAYIIGTGLRIDF